ncbi:hypothetical protein, partial [Sphingomonas sp.]|uniref:hypothetical protein n=1 Tax=Sphingomonas sp. TaxID=28214 RepID=UPI0025D3B71D
MPMQGYSVGRDVTLVVTLPDGTSLHLGKVTGFNPKQDVTDQKIKRLDGFTDNLRFFDGWSGTFKMERDGPALDQYFAALESNFYAGGDEQPAILTQTILEPNGSVTQWRFERVLLRYDDSGDWAGDK